MYRVIRHGLLLLALLAWSQPVFAQDCRSYFFATIARAEGQPANDWPAVLGALPGRGFGINPAPGQVQPANAPHYGMTVMIDAGGHARGRIWLATDAPEAGGWYTHEIQVIADGPTPGSFVWAWQDIGGAPPRPCGGSSAPPVVPLPVPDAALAQQVAALKAQVEALLPRVEQLEVNPPRVLLMDALLKALRQVPFDCQISRTGPGFLSHGHACTVTVK